MMTPTTYTTYVVYAAKYDRKSDADVIDPTRPATRHASADEALAEAERRRGTGEHVLVVTEDFYGARSVPQTSARDVVGTRNRLGVSQAQLAAKLGVDVMTVSRWERGEREPAPYLTLALQHLICETKRRRLTRKVESAD